MSLFSKPPVAGSSGSTSTVGSTGTTGATAVPISTPKDPDEGKKTLAAAFKKKETDKRTIKIDVPLVQISKAVTLSDVLEAKGITSAEELLGALLADSPDDLITAFLAICDNHPSFRNKVASEITKNTKLASEIAKIVAL